MIFKVSSTVEFSRKSSVAFLNPGTAMIVRIATIHRATMISIRVKPPLPKTPTLEHFNVLANSDARMGKFAQRAMQNRIKL
jgi:hypothetical protein